jgi:hypothetical protein
MIRRKKKQKENKLWYNCGNIWKKKGFTVSSIFLNAIIIEKRFLFFEKKTLNQKSVLLFHQAGLNPLTLVEHSNYTNIKNWKNPIFLTNSILFNLFISILAQKNFVLKNHSFFNFRPSFKTDRASFWFELDMTSLHLKKLVKKSMRFKIDFIKISRIVNFFIHFKIKKSRKNFFVTRHNAINSLIQNLARCKLTLNYFLEPVTASTNEPIQNVQ